MALIPGKVGALNNSMAKDIEDAFLAEYARVMGKPAPGSNEQMQLLFVAVAQGVIKHLKDHVDSFHVAIDTGTATGSTGTGSAIDFQETSS